MFHDKNKEQAGPRFDRGFTGHEHLSRFGLVNMNSRMYDPFTASFLSADRFVQDPSSAQGFNRYAYCMHNPLRYVDPSGWRHWQPAPGSTPSAGDHFRDIYAYSERAYEPGDFRNAYYLCNMAFYENIKGPGGGSGNNLGYIGSYGYYATHQANSVYNPTSLMNILQDWQNHPSYITNKNLQDMGVSDMTAGELYGSYNGSPGYRNTYYTWTDSEGNPHHTEVLYEYVGGNRNGVYAVSNQPLWMYDARSLLENSVILAQSLGIPLGTIAEGVEMAAKSYHHVPLLKIRSGLTHAQKVAALSKEGVALLKASKGIGIVGASISVGINLYQTIDYGLKGGTDVNVYAKTSLDIVMTGVSFLGPIGLAAGTTYFIVDLATDSFGGWGKIP